MSHKKILLFVLLIPLVLILLLVGLNLRSTSDSTNNVDSISLNFYNKISLKQIGYDTIVTFDEGQLKLRNNQLFFKPNNGQEKPLNLSDVSNKYGFSLSPQWQSGGDFYIEYPYSFFVLTGEDSNSHVYDSVLIYNLSNDKYKIIDLKSSDSCGSSAFIHKIAYEAGNIYWKQYREWSNKCTGNFMRKMSLDF